MLPNIAMFLLAACLLVAVVGCVMFVSVAFAGPSANSDARPKSKPAWEPVLDCNAALRSWASHMAASVTESQLAAARSKDTALGIAAALYAGNAQAISRLREEEAKCSARCHEMIGVTAPEALSIADAMRHVLDPAEIERVRRVAAANVQQLDKKKAQLVAAQLTCPMLTADGTCAAFSARPLSCRTECVVCANANEVDTDEVDTDSWKVPQQVALSVLARGIREGLSSGLVAAGVDANRYELSSALLVASENFDASERWACGEPVFAGCASFE
jgi:Fe-S-cluster containining protein